MKKFLSGFLLGAVIFGSSTALAAGILAEKSNQDIWVDGEKIQMEAYNIGGNNYVKLRDIAQAVNFSVEYDDDKKAVEIDSTKEYPPEKPAANVVTLPTDGSRYVPKIGDVLKADNDDYFYAISDLSRYDNSMFSVSEEETALPEPTCDWSQFPDLELPLPEVRHFSTTNGEYLFVRNLYEMRRMQYTMYNLIGSNPNTWQDGKLVLKGDGTPLAEVGFDVGDKEAYSFWPFRESQLENVFNGWASGSFQLEAWDVYKDGAFQYTEYLVYAE